jgi:hypothetical protein
MTEQRKQGPGAPRTFAEAARAAAEQPVIYRMTDEEAEAAEQNAEEVDLGGSGGEGSGAESRRGDVPPWARVPSDLVFPPGKQVWFMNFKAALTDRPDLGDRSIVCWGLTDADEKLAIKATRGDSGRTISELAKRTIRAIDGKRADWMTGKIGQASVDRFWDHVGPRYRPMIISAYWKTHSLSVEETADFLLHSIAYRTAVAG